MWDFDPSGTRLNREGMLFAIFLFMFVVALYLAWRRYEIRKEQRQLDDELKKNSDPTESGKGTDNAG